MQNLIRCIIILSYILLMLVSCNQSPKAKEVHDISNNFSKIDCDSLFSTDFLKCTNIYEKIINTPNKYYIINFINDYKPALVVYVSQIDTAQVDLLLVRVNLLLTHDSLNISKTPCHKILSSSTYYTINVLEQKSIIASYQSIKYFMNFINDDFWQLPDQISMDDFSRDLEVCSILGYNSNKCHKVTRLNYEKNYNSLMPIQQLLDYLKIKEYAILK